MPSRQARPEVCRHPPTNMVPAIAYMASEEFTTTGIMIKVEADGQLALYTNPTEYNQCGKDCLVDGAYTIEELRDIFQNQLLKGAQVATTNLVVTKSEY